MIRKLNFKGYKILALIILVLAIFTSYQPSYAKTTAEQVKEIDQYVQEILQDTEFSGVILAARKGKPIYTYVSGYQDFRIKKPLEIDSTFNLESISKQFTSMAIMILKERGKLEYSDDIRKYLPELSYKGVTIKNLLTHTWGIDEGACERLMGEYWETTNKTITNKVILDLIAKNKPPLRFEPGSEYAYSNVGYDMLALIIEKVSGESYQEFLQKNIFDPVGMKNTVVYTYDKNPEVYKRAYGFHKTDSGEYQLDDVTPLDSVVGDYGIYTNVEDMLKWDQALYTEKLVKKPTLEEAFAQTTTSDGNIIDYGFAWVPQISQGKKIVWHGGAYAGFRNAFFRNIDDNSTVIVFTNGTNQSEFLTIASGIKDILTEDVED